MTRRPLVRYVQARALLLALAAAAFATAGAAAHEPGDLDESFGIGGVRFVDFGRSEQASEVFKSGDAGFILAGGSQEGVVGRDPRIALARLSAGGRLDRSFGNSGRIEVDPTSARDFEREWAATAGGGFVSLVAREPCGGCGAFAVVRFRADGSLADSFGDNGVVLGRFAGDGASPADVLVQPSGKVMVVGRTAEGAVLKRYRTDGSRDTRFGNGGVVRVPGMQNATILRQPEGRILLLGTRAQDEIFIVGRRPDGRRDPSFGYNGSASWLIDAQGINIGVNGGTVDADGRIVAIGSARDAGTLRFDIFVARLGAGGDPDRGFGGGDGWRRIDFGNVDSPRDVVALPSGRLVIAGAVARDVFGDHPDEDVILAALRPDGRLWKPFGTDGRVREDFGRENEAVIGLDAEVANGKLVVAGLAGPGGGGEDDMFAARFQLARH